MKRQRDTCVTPKRIKVAYYAVFREQAGVSEEWVQSSAPSAEALYQELRLRHGFSLDPQRLRVAVNAEFQPWSQALQDGDEVVFIPPVAGG